MFVVLSDLKGKVSKVYAYKEHTVSVSVINLFQVGNTGIVTGVPACKIWLSVLGWFDVSTVTRSLILTRIMSAVERCGPQ